ncbi:MAG: hypothetical protein JSW60_03000 [Thermoplasmatales archaeon]|nr:MAG: hypothetical protein JSW60_03000 [Thermoplasmatales archaeon]
MVNIKKDKSTNNKQELTEDDLDFMLWKTELVTELLSFWRSIPEIHQEQKNP